MNMLSRAAVRLSALLACALAVAQPVAAQVALATPNPSRTGLPGASAFTGEEWMDFRQNGVRVSLPAYMVAEQAAKQPLPSGFQWQGGVTPNLYRTPNGRWYTDLDPKTVASIAPLFNPASVASGLTINYYVSPAGSDSNSGLTVALPLASLWKPKLLCNVSAATYCNVFAQGGVGAPAKYDRTKDLLGTGAGDLTSPTKTMGYTCYGGRCLTGPFQLGLTWAANGTYPAVYQTARSAVDQAVNLAATDAYGDNPNYVAQTSIANVAACTTTDCAYNDGTNEYVKRADGAAPTDANTMLLLNATGMKLGTASFYLAGFDVVGGGSGTIQANTAATHDIVVEDSSFRYSGLSSSAHCAVLDNFQGIAAFFRSKFHKCASDGINPHSTNGFVLSVLDVDSDIADIGKSLAAVSNNCWTGHDGTSSSVAVAQITIAGTCTAAAGGAIRYVQYAQQAVFGAIVDSDQGDLAHTSGAEASTCAQADNNVKLWLYDVRCARDLNSLAVGAGTTVSIRRFTDGGGARIVNGTLSAF